MNRKHFLATIGLGIALLECEAGTGGGMVMASLKPRPGGQDVTPDGIELILVIGDSTAAGSNNSGGVGPTVPTGQGLCYVRSGNTIRDIGSTDVFGTSAGSQFPQMCMDYYALTKRQLCIIPSAVGSSTIVHTSGTNDWSTSGVNYVNAVSDAKSAMLIKGVARLAAIFIDTLGINDVRGAQSTANILAAQQDLILRIQTDFPNVPIFIGQIGPDGSGNAASMNYSGNGCRRSWKKICEDNTNCELIAGLIADYVNGYIGADNLHPSQAGNNLRGFRNANHFAMYRKGQYSKWSRSIISAHYDSLSDTRRGYIENLIGSRTTAYLGHDFLFVHRSTLRTNLFVDWTLVNSPQTDPGFTFAANDCITFDGVATYFRTGYRQSGGNRLAITDGQLASKVKTNNTAAASPDACLIGSFFGSEISILQRSTSVIQYKALDVTATTDATDTAFINGKEYATIRDAGNKRLYKDWSQIASAAVVNQGTCGVEVIEGAYGTTNNNTSLAKFWGGSSLYCRGNQFSVDGNFAAALQTLLNSW